MEGRALSSSNRRPVFSVARFLSQAAVPMISLPRFSRSAFTGPSAFLTETYHLSLWGLSHDPRTVSIQILTDLSLRPLMPTLVNRTRLVYVPMNGQFPPCCEEYRRPKPSAPLWVTDHTLEISSQQPPA